MIFILVSSIYKMGLPPHWSMDVRGSLNATFPNRWIGRDGPIRWPSLSPDITPLDFFFWSYVKDRIFATPANDIGELRNRIRDMIATYISNSIVKLYSHNFSTLNTNHVYLIKIKFSITQRNFDTVSTNLYNSLSILLGNFLLRCARGCSDLN